MPFRRLAPALFALGLVAAGPAPTPLNVKPGLWETTIRTESWGTPSIPPEALSPDQVTGTNTLRTGDFQGLTLATRLEARLAYFYAPALRGVDMFLMSWLIGVLSAE